MNRVFPTTGTVRVPEFVLYLQPENRELVKRVEELLQRVPLSQALCDHIASWKTFAATFPLTDDLDKAIILTELICYIIRPAIRDNDFTLSTLDIKLGKLLQIFLPEVDAEAFIDKKCKVDAEFERNHPYTIQNGFDRFLCYYEKTRKQLALFSQESATQAKPLFVALSQIHSEPSSHVIGCPDSQK